MDPRYILAIENSMRSVCNFRHVLIRDEMNQTAAAACVFLHDRRRRAGGRGSQKSRGRHQSRRADPVASEADDLRTPQFRAPRAICVPRQADREACLRQIDEVMQSFAREEGSHCAVYKEFTTEEAGNLVSLEKLGYHRADSVPMNCVPSGYRSFDDYIARIGSAKRRTIRRSREKFARFGLKVEHRLGGEGVGRYHGRSAQAV